MIYGDITTLRMIAASIKRSREVDVERATLGIDGNSGFALLGENLQEGEVEFAEIKRQGCRHSMQAACYEALSKLRARFPHRMIAYQFDESYPR